MKRMIISIDATQGAEKFWEEINEAHEAIMKAEKAFIVAKIKSWF